MKKEKFRLSRAFGIPLVTAVALSALNYSEVRSNPAQDQAVSFSISKKFYTLAGNLGSFASTSWQEIKSVGQSLSDFIGSFEKSEVPQERSCSTSQEGIDFIRGFEKCRLEVYKDEAGRDTVCYGHLLNPGESREPRTQEECNDLFAEDLAEHSRPVNLNVKVPLNQNQYDALVSLTYNIGSSAFRNSTLLKNLNSKNYNAAAEQFNVWNKVTRDGVKKVSNGLTTRRARERDIFESGVYDSKH